MKILVTGGTGFIGKALILELLKHEHEVTAAVRKNTFNFPENVTQEKINDLFEFENKQIFKNVETVIHCAGRAHILHGDVVEPLELFREVNTVGTLKLAKQAAAAGVKRFIFISSVGVSGNINKKPFVESDNPNPQEAYAISKYEAELALLNLSKITDLEVVIIRPPLVYGPNAPGNFPILMHWMSKNIWLPFGSIHNKRSFIFLENLVDFILTCINHPNAKNQVFLVSDNEDLSTTELLKRISKAFNNKSKLLPVNQKTLEITLNLLGKKSLAQRLCSSLQIDISKSQKRLNWKPPFSVDEGLQKTTTSYIEKIKYPPLKLTP